MGEDAIGATSNDKISKKISSESIFKQVGKDSLRYYMISTKNETPIDFNIDKVIEKNKDNQVFYCQYAYARASSIINKAKKHKNFNIDLSDFISYSLNNLIKKILRNYMKLLSLSN